MRIALAICLLVSANRLSGRAGTAGGGRNAKQVAAVATLGVLGCDSSTLCDLHLVADDWTAGTWTDRASNYNAALTGVPTKSSSAQFTGRSGLSGFSSTKYFRLASNINHILTPSTAITYEVVVKYVGTAPNWGGVILTQNSDAAGVGISFAANNGINLGVINGAVTDYAINVTTADDVVVSGRNYLLTFTLDGATKVGKIWVNGTDVTVAAAASGALTPASASFVDIGEQTSFTSPLAGQLLEIVRHKSVLSDATIRSHALIFNQLRGY